MKHISKKEKSMSLDAPMYVYATEMVGAYYEAINVRNKKVLTIVGSGDQVLNAIEQGAKKIYGFDLNKNAQHMINLKLASVKTLNYSEFLDYFGEKPNSGFSYNIYTKIRKRLDKKTAKFFDNLYRKYNLSGLKVIKSDKFRQRDDISINTKEINYYLKDNKRYLNLKKRIKKIKFQFVRSDIKSIADKVNTKFDLINLSNVPNYVVQRLESNDKFGNFYKTVLLKIRKILNKNGLLFFYSYSDKSYPNIVAKRVPIASTNTTLSYLKERKEFKVKQFQFKGINKAADRITALYRI
jgi:hypothetical protein